MLVTSLEYNSRGFSGGENDERIQLALKRAESAVDAVTGGACEKAVNTDNALSDEKKSLLIQAVCTQCEHYLNSPSYIGETWKLGDFSYSSKSGGISRPVYLITDLTASVLRMGGFLPVSVNV